MAGVVGCSTMKRLTRFSMSSVRVVSAVMGVGVLLFGFDAVICPDSSPALAG